MRLLDVLLRNVFSEMSLNVSLGLEKSVGGKYRRSREAPSVLLNFPDKFRITIY